VFVALPRIGPYIIEKSDTSLPTQIPMQKTQKPITAELLRTLFEATASTTGDEFFRALARHLAIALEAKYAFVSELVEKGKLARTLAYWSDGSFLDNMDYEVSGTPCELVLQGRIVQISDNLLDQYPAEKALGIPLQSYVGIPLVGRYGKVIGHVVAMDVNPMEEKARDFSTFQVFAIRATAELERKQAEQALDRAQLWLVQSEKMAALGQLTAGVAHEINNPIGVIQSNLDSIARSTAKLRHSIGDSVPTARMEGDEAAKWFQIIQQSSEASSKASARITGLVENLQKFTRIDEAPFQETNLHEGLDSTLELLKPFLKSGVTVAKSYGQIPRIHADVAELNQVFMTLLRNANDAIDGEGKITVTTSADDAYVYVHVADDGRGLTENQQASLFDFGFSRKRERVGMRFGLPIASNIIKNHNGKITVDSAAGKGTEISIQLPIHQQ
jgi:signal transduction histidine kinase